MNITVNRLIKPENYDITKSLAIMEPNNKANFNTSTLKNNIINTNKENKNINGLSILEVTYNGIDNINGSVERKESWIDKNGAIYSVIYTKGIKNTYESNNTNTTNNSNSTTKISGENGFNIVINSLKIEDQELRKNNQYIGEIIIPKLNKSLKIRTYTVNAYNAVYHYNDSYYPGETGALRILGITLNIQHHLITWIH